MLTRTYTLRFLTPAFLGNADQNGQWRTPPIKALLRQWWRVAYAAEQTGAVDVGAMRAAEGRLFGVAADRDGESRQSRVRIRLNRWDAGRLTSWAGSDTPVKHPEVKSPVGAQLYLGYGPLIFSNGGTALKARAAIQANEEATLDLAFPSGPDAARLDRALALMHRFGTLGGRSRNGWGSFSLKAAKPDTPMPGAMLDESLLLAWADALSLDWPHAIGSDKAGALIWQTEPVADWKTVMRRFAEIKIGLRTQFVFPPVKPPHPQPLERHWLSYPITKHATTAWDKKARLPNSLRFKVRADGAQLRGVIFHVPCKPPPEFKPDRKALVEVWTRVHAFLDRQPKDKLTRIAA